MRGAPQHEADPARMVLRTTLTSPYGRKVRMAAMVLGLADRIDIVPADTLDPHDDLRLQNPLGKMPCLLVNGDALFDSRVILAYLDELAGGGRLVPARGMTRFRALTRMALADGVTDAGLLVTYEGRFREPDQASERWLAHQRGKIERGLSALAADPPDPRATDGPAIALACTLGYLSWRKPVDWRAVAPDLAHWLTAFKAAEPAFDATEPP